jgi:META domain
MTNLFHRLVIAAAALMMMASAAAALDPSAVIGEWKIAEIYDDNGPERNPLDMPTSGGPYLIRFREKEGRDNTLSFYSKIGNSLVSSVTFEEGSSDQIHFGNVVSTKMMPELSQYKLEVYLSRYLPTMTTLTVSEDKQRLVLTGEGRIVCESADTTDE